MSGEVPMIGTPAFPGHGQLERRLSAELDDHAVRLLHVDDFQHILEVSGSKYRRSEVS